jgi:hypothetical protein
MKKSTRGWRLMREMKGALEEENVYKSKKGNGIEGKSMDPCVRGCAKMKTEEKGRR